MSEWHDDTEEIGELEAELLDFRRGVTWQKVMRPSLQKRQDEISRKLCVGTKMSLEDIREQQIIYNFISQLLSDPIQFFTMRKVD